MAQGFPERFPADEPSLREIGARFFLRLIDEDVYFVNLTRETLRTLDAGGTSFATFDDDMVTTERKSMVHENVAPGEAVRIGDYDAIFDGDFISYFVFDILHPDGTSERVSYTVGKSEIPHGVIAWEHREPVSHPDGTPMTATEAVEKFLQGGGRPLNPATYLNRADLLAEYANTRLAPCGLSRRLVSRPRTTLIDFIDEAGRLVWRADTPEAATAFLAALRNSFSQYTR